MRRIGKDGVVFEGGVAVMVGLVVGVGRAPWPPVALTRGPLLNLPLGGGGRRLAGEGTVVVGEGASVMGVLG